MNPSTNKEKLILVIDSESIFLLPTSPANARRLLNSRQARVQEKNPFTIQLTKKISSPNMEAKMKALNLFEYFKEPRPIYIQNIAMPIGVISLEFKRPNGEVVPYRVPANRNPILLTNAVPFDAIRDSASFLKFLQPSGSGPARLQLLTEEEYLSFYKDKQKTLEASSVDEVIQEAQINVDKFNTDIVSKKPIVEERASLPPKVPSEVLALEPNPRVIAVCQQLDPANSSKISVREALDVFTSLDLEEIDYSYIMGHSYEHAVKENAVLKKWAVKKQQDLFKKNEGIVSTKTVEATNEVAKKRGRKPKNT